MLTLSPRVVGDRVDVGRVDEHVVPIPSGHHDLGDNGAARRGVGEAAAEEHPTGDRHRRHLGPRVGTDLLVGCVVLLYVQVSKRLFLGFVILTKLPEESRF